MRSRRHAAKPMLNKRIPTQAQIDAARQNGAKSRGPRVRSATTKSFSAHLDTLSRIVLLPEESEKLFKRMGRSIFNELSPETEIEAAFVTKVVLACWRQFRAVGLESSIIGRAIVNGSDHGFGGTVPADAHPAQRAGAAFESMDPSGRFAISQYEARFDRQFIRSLDAFDRYRAARLRRIAEKSDSGTPNPGSATKQTDSPDAEPES